MTATRAVFAALHAGCDSTEYKIGHDPVTEADRARGARLRRTYCATAKLASEETVDNPQRLERERVWM